MSSFLRRISPTSNLNTPSFAKVAFDLDEPDFSLVQKFSCSNNKNKQKRRTIKICRTCGNAEFSYKSKYCKICGTEIDNFF